MKHEVGKYNDSTREAWVAKVLKEIPPGSRILDAGAGEKIYEKHCLHLDYVSQDFCKYDGKGNEKGLQVGLWNPTSPDIISDITEIPEPNGSFEAIMCIEVFEHLPAPIRAIQEFYRLLKKNGLLIITAPFCSLTHFAPYHYYSGFNRYFYKTNVSMQGFEILEITENGNYFEYIAQEVRRIPEVARRYTGKPSGILDYILIKLVLRMLNKYSKQDNGSKEILNYGFFVKAIRR